MSKGFGLNIPGGWPSNPTHEARVQHKWVFDGEPWLHHWGMATSVLRPWAGLVDSHSPPVNSQSQYGSKSGHGPRPGCPLGRGHLTSGFHLPRPASKVCTLILRQSEPPHQRHNPN